MCGIFGAIRGSYQITAYEMAKFTEQALAVGSLRGKDSVGMFFGKYGQHLDWIKRLSTGEELVDCDTYAKRRDGVVAADFIVGHHRSATVGKVSIENAHPFSEGAITLVHNGTLRGQYPLFMYRSKEVTVDSHAICLQLNEVAPEEADSIFQKIDGAFAVVWHDSRDNSVNLLRNDERPLYIFSSKDGKCHLFSSEEGMTRWLADRIGIDVGNASPLPVGEHWKFVDKANKPSITKVRLPVRYVAPAYVSGTWEDLDYAGVYGGHGSWPNRRAQMSAVTTVVTPIKETVLPLMRAAMDAILVSPNFRMPFVPVSFMGTRLMNGSKTDFCEGVVVGNIDSLGMPAVIYNMNARGAIAMMSGRWLVRAEGVQHAGADGKAMLVCKLVKRPGQWRNTEVVLHDAAVQAEAQTVSSSVIALTAELVP